MASTNRRGSSGLYRCPPQAPSATSQDWKSGQKPSTLLEIDGLFVFQNKRYRGWMGMKDLRGLRWAEPETERSPLVVMSRGKTIASISLETPKIRITPLKQDGKVRFKLRTKLTGNVIELFEQLPKSELERLAEDTIAEQIGKTYANGLEIDADLLQLEQSLYRWHNREWKRRKRESEGRLQPDSLADVVVQVSIRHSGKLKY